MPTVKPRSPEAAFAHGDDVRAERNWISWSVADGALHRHVRRRSGAFTKSTMPGVASTGNLPADFDLAWMRAKSRPLQQATSDTLRVADLFAGCGAMSLGVEEACRAVGLKFESSFASELDPVKAEVYRRNFQPPSLAIGPVEEILNGELGGRLTPEEKQLTKQVGEIDLVLGGPPCQGHSDLNNHTRRDDVRNGLVTRMARFAELFRPRDVVIENVQGIRHDRQGASSLTATYLEGLGYRVEECLIACAPLGVPQNRRRYMLVASLRHAPDVTNALSHLASSVRPASWALEDLLDREGIEVFDTAATLSKENARRVAYLFKHGLHDLPDSERPACHRLKPHAYRSVYGRMHWDQPAPTITTGFGSNGQGRFVHPLRSRTITPHEAARLQTIPDFFDFGTPGRTQLQKMIGNSVPPLAMTAIGIQLLR